MENKHLFFPSPAAHEGLLRGFLLGYSLAWPRSCPGVLQQPQSPCCLIPPSVPWEHPWLPGSLHVAPGTKAFLKADFLICCGAELGSASMQTQQQLPPFHPARAVNYSFPWIPDSLSPLPVLWLPPPFLVGEGPGHEDLVLRSHLHQFYPPEAGTGSRNLCAHTAPSSPSPPGDPPIPQPPPARNRSDLIGAGSSEANCKREAKSEELREVAPCRDNPSRILEKAIPSLARGAAPWRWFLL